MSNSKLNAETTLSTIPKLISQVLSIYEVDSRKVFEDSEIEFESLSRADTRITMEAMGKLWLHASRSTNNSELGLICASLFQPAYIKGLGLAWMASENLLEGLKLFTSNSKLVNTALAIDLVETESEVIIKYSSTAELNKDFRVHPCAIQLGVGFFLKMFRLAAGKTIPATAVYFSYPIEEATECYEEFFQCPLYSQHSFNGIAFSKQLLVELLPTHDADLVESNKASIKKYLVELEESEIVTNVTKLIIELLPSGTPTEEELAYRLHMSKRTLQRKLKADGKAFSQLLSEIRSGLARKYLVTTKLPITEIAYLVGYSSPSAFARAFKQVFLKSPNEFRLEDH